MRLKCISLTMGKGGTKNKGRCGNAFDILVLDLLFLEHELDSLHERAEPAYIELQGVLGGMSLVNTNVGSFFWAYSNFRNGK